MRGPALSSSPGDSRLEAIVLACLLALLPFEPRQPRLEFLGLQWTLLEIAAVLALALLAGLAWRRRARLRVLSPLPLLLLVAFALANLVSAAVAPSHRGEALAFSLRMAACAAFAVLVAAAGAEARRHALAAFACSAVFLAALLVGEGWGLPLDSFLDLFRSAIHRAGDARRAAGPSESPNLAAAMVAHGLIVAAALPGPGRRSALGAAAWAAVFGYGLLETYSRGGLFASLAGLAALCVLAGRHGRARAAAPAAALGALVAVFAGALLTSRAHRERFGLAASPPRLAARFEPEDRALSLRPDEKRHVRVRIVNLSAVAWRPGDELQLAPRWHERGSDRFWDGALHPLPRSVAAGDSLTLAAALEAPAREGDFELVWDLLAKDASGRAFRWLSALGNPPAVVPVAVGREPTRGAARRVAVPQRIWLPDRAGLWALALEMWRTHPVTGVGPDNFRKLAGEWSPVPFAETSVYSNNTFLEAAATTGTLGLLSLAGALVTTAWSALRAAWRAPSAAEGAQAGLGFALAVELLSHAWGDYFLAFTGHYLFLAFLVGSVAALGPSRQPANA